MNKVRIFLLLTFLLTAFGYQLQAQTFDQLKFKTFPDTWSKRLEADRMVFSNYNVLGSNPMSVTMYRSLQHTGKPEEGFKKIWRQTFALPDTALVPKFRKLANMDGNLWITANAELEGPEGKGFYQLNVYFFENGMQAILLNAISQKAFKPIMYEWQERLAEVSVVKRK